MEVTALCIRLMIEVQFVLIALAQHSYCAKKEDAAFPHIHPTRLQFFEYESISLSCKSYNSTDMTVMRRLKEINISGENSNWMISKGSGTIKPAFSTDSGAYWCEDKEGHKSNSVNITVTAGTVILESPVLPVKKGDPMRLQCKKKNSSDLIADFYKNGVLLKTGYKGYITINNVSTADEAFYKCNFSKDEESPESWLAVTELHEPGHHPLDQLPNLQTLLWIVVSFSLVALLLLALGVTYCRKRRRTEDQNDATTDRVTGGVAEPQNVIYATVKKPRKKEEQDVSYIRTGSNLQEENIIYSSITCATGY